MLKCSPVPHQRSRKSLRILLTVLGGILLIGAFALLTGWLNTPLSNFIAQITQRPPKPGWNGYFRTGGMILLAGVLMLFLSEKLIEGFQRMLEWGKAWLARTDEWLAQKTSGLLQTPETTPSEWPLHFNRWDALIILFFVLIAFLYQVAMLSPGYPNVILGGDAANIASFAAARAFPDLFKNDVLMGNPQHLGLYVTVHLPIVIWLEKLVGNFGLAYSLLLFPHVFLQYLAYYLLGRVIFHQRYWALLFSLAASSPLVLDGGEVWGIISNALPRVTFQVLIPFLLILLLSAWRERPGRWPWIMVILGLMAFVHPVSAPVWAFALWFGFWFMFPAARDTRRKLWEMLKLGGVLVLAILPYVSIYLTYHESGNSKSNYDLAYYILSEYFPENILNIPGAVNTFLHSTAQFGLLWYGLAGLILTFLLFRGERPRLKQLLTWVAGIVIISILVPWIENTIERLLRLIPLQTELMRGMRYLVPFLLVFWFYPFAELTRRSVRAGLTRAVFAVGTLLTLGWLVMNPPQPFVYTSHMLNCWRSGQFICPNNTAHSDALTYIREETPEGAKFAVFLTNRWSGIEVRYLGLRPMVYAYKDRGQLVYTNIEALQEWYSDQQRENEIYSPRKTPTVEEKRLRIVEFARQAGADYILTNFPFPPDVQSQLNVIAVYQNSSYSVLKTSP
ncbi:MAG TPA: hypothetical protein VLE49_07790 [Anaerolineales bacterium]|nr:hypothetical protein [Anaerolineales bacterium]